MACPPRAISPVLTGWKTSVFVLAGSFSSPPSTPDPQVPQYSRNQNNGYLFHFPLQLYYFDPWIAVSIWMSRRRPRRQGRGDLGSSAAGSRHAPASAACAVAQLTQQLEAWADEYKGDYELRVLGKRVIVVTDPVDVRRILSLRPSKFMRGLTPVSRRPPPSSPPEACGFM